MENYNKSLKDTIIPYIMNNILSKIADNSTDWVLKIDNYQVNFSKESYDYYRNNKLSCNVEVVVNYHMHRRGGGGVVRETISFTIPQMVKSVFVISGDSRTYNNFFEMSSEFGIKPNMIKLGNLTYFADRGRINVYVPGYGRNDFDVSDIENKEVWKGVDPAVKAELNISDRVRKKVRVVYGFDPGKKVTKEALDRMILEFKPTYRDHAVTKQLMTVDRALLVHIERCTPKLLRTLSGEFFKNTGIYPRTLQSTINNFFRGRSESVEAIHYPDNMNELDFLVASKKAIMETNSAVANAKGIGMTRYNHTFFDIVDASVTPDNGNVNRVNELAQIVKVMADGNIEMKVYDKKFNEIYLTIEDYMLADVLHSEQVDYANKRVIPADSYKVKHRGSIRYSDTFDYIDLHQDERLATTTRMIPMASSCDSIRVGMGSKMTRQAISCYLAEPPLIASGHENISDVSPLCLKVKSEDEAQEVIESDALAGFMVLQGVKSKKKKKVEIPSPIYAQKRTAINFIPAEKGKVLKPGDLIYRSINMAQDGQLQLGVNLLTAYMYWYGFDFEDSVIVSESASKKLSHIGEFVATIEIKHGDELTGLLEPGTCVSAVGKNGYSRHLLEVEREVEVNRALEGLNNIVQMKEVRKKKVRLSVPNNITRAMITSVGFYEVSKDETQRKELERISNIDYRENVQAQGQVQFLETYPKLTTRKVEVPKKLPKSDSLGTSYVIYVKIAIENVLGVADKLTNRFGSKGVAGVVVPDDEMPRTEDGRIIEVIMNPSSTIARKNLPQISELNLSVITEEVYRRISLIPRDDEGWENTKILLNKVHLDYLARYKRKDFYEYHDSLKDSKLKYQYKTGAFSPLSPLRVGEIMEDLQISDKVVLRSGKKTGYRRIKAPIMVGYQYMMKLHHMADFSNKITLEDEKDRNPLVLGLGMTRNEGQKLGEMESVA